jgi:D-tyrosyl-tRNA(Tyr) deacylase
VEYSFRILALFPDKVEIQRMIALLQRVSRAEVTIDDEAVGSIGPGLLVLIGVRPTDDEASAKRLLTRLLLYRVFPDEAGKMNLSLTQVKGQLLLVPQFTLAADTAKGLRPGFSTAAPPEQGRRLFEFLVQAARDELGAVETGLFGAHMQVSLTNDGPVTIWLES